MITLYIAAGAFAYFFIAGIVAWAIDEYGYDTAPALGLIWPIVGVAFLGALSADEMRSAWWAVAGWWESRNKGGS